VSQKSKSKKFHRWPVCPVTGLQRLGEMKDVRLALRAAEMSRTNAALKGGEASWRVRSAFQCTQCNGGFHLSTQAPTPMAEVA
jgi:hypothetical protein